MSALIEVMSVLSDVTTLLDHSDVFVPMATSWLRMVDIVAMSMNVRRRPTIASINART